MGSERPLGSRQGISISLPAWFGACSPRAMGHFGLVPIRGWQAGRVASSRSTRSFPGSIFLLSLRIGKARYGPAADRIPLRGSFARFNKAEFNVTEPMGLLVLA